MVGHLYQMRQLGNTLALNKRIGMNKKDRQAMEMALDALENTIEHLPVKSGVRRDVEDAIKALEDCLDSPVLKPVAWRKVWTDNSVSLYDYRPVIFDDNELEPLYTGEVE